MRIRLVAAVLTGLALHATVASPPATAQGVRGSLHSTGRYVELRPLRRDTIPRELVTDIGQGTFVYEGMPASCDVDTCIVFRAGDVEHALVATQDLDVTAWGFGVEGLSATVLLRNRAQLAGDFRQPLAGESFEAILAYAELTRGRYRVRAGRQRELSGLGFSGFDGVDLLFDATPALSLQVYGGRSLARALQQPLARAFRDVEERDFIRDRDAYLLGAAAAYETRGGSKLALRYQGEIWGDRAGLLSERALLVGRTAELRPFVIGGSLEYDVGYGRLGKAHIDARLPLPAYGVQLEATARRYVPFFDYWTIWGVFSPVAYHETELRASWTPGPRLGVWGSGAYRWYGAHHTQTFLAPLEDDAWRAGLGGEWRATDALRVDASLYVEGPLGAFAIAGDAALAWRLAPRFDITAHALVVEQVEEFRVGAGVVAGGGIGADVRLSDELRVAGGGALYRQTQPDRPGAADWTQRRAWFSVRLGLGRDPGLPRGTEP
jgi:hypothetical protein